MSGSEACQRVGLTGFQDFTGLTGYLVNLENLEILSKTELKIIARKRSKVSYDV